MQGETQRDTVTRWFADGTTWVGVFQNADLGSFAPGHRVAIPFDVKDFDRATIGRDRAPEMVRKYGLIPWQYILVAKCTTPEEVFFNLVDEK